ncbi:MAG: Gfo/Idh/MocA family oxidoreductase [Acidobacteriota bacterium]
MAASRVAVLGCGYWGRNLVRNFHELGCLAAVADVSDAGRAEARRIAPGAWICETFEEAIAIPEVSGVVVATPAATHAPIALAAIDAGKDVLCEKPLALTLKDARLLTQRAAVRSRILMVGHVLEYHPAIRKLRELCAEGQLGKLHYVYSTRLNLGKVRTEENILWSFAPHDIAIILRLIGALPFQVSASGGAYIQPNLYDVTVTQLLFDNGVAAHVFVSWLNPFKEQRLVVVGSRRMATFDDVKKELLLYDQRVDLKEGEPVPVKGQGTRIDYAPDEPLRLECQAFLEAIASRETPLTDARSALDVLRVLQASQRSLVTQGQPVPLPME